MSRVSHAERTRLAELKGKAREPAGSEAERVSRHLAALQLLPLLTNGTGGHSEEDVRGDVEAGAPEKTVTSDRDVNSIELTAPDDECLARARLVENLEDAIDGLETALEAERERCRDDVQFVSYESEQQMAEIMRLIQKDLSEPYSIYTYRYFIHNWPRLCFLAMHEGGCVGAIVCKLDVHRNTTKRGYIAMLAVDEKYRKRKIGSRLVQQAIQAMTQDNADEVVLETEITNKPALRLYENLGFVRDKRLFRYYLNGVDALRLKLWLR